MRSTSAALALALLLTACTDGSGTPEVPGPGPLELTGVEAACLALGSKGESAEIEVPAGEALNPSELPLTVDSVSLLENENVTLLDAFLLPDGRGADAVPAEDATIVEKAASDVTHSVILRVQVNDVTKPAKFNGFAVEYHNVEGDFRSVGTGEVEMLTGCRP